MTYLTLEDAAKMRSRCKVSTMTIEFVGGVKPQSPWTASGDVHLVSYIDPVSELELIALCSRVP